MALRVSIVLVPIDGNDRMRKKLVDLSRSMGNWPSAEVTCLCLLNHGDFARDLEKQNFFDGFRWEGFLEGDRSLQSMSS